MKKKKKNKFFNLSKPMFLPNFNSSSKNFDVFKKLEQKKKKIFSIFFFEYVLFPTIIKNPLWNYITLKTYNFPKFVLSQQNITYNFKFTNSKKFSTLFYKNTFKFKKNYYLNTIDLNNFFKTNLLLIEKKIKFNYKIFLHFYKNNFCIDSDKMFSYNYFLKINFSKKIRHNKLTFFLKSDWKKKKNRKLMIFDRYKKNISYAFKNISYFNDFFGSNPYFMNKLSFLNNSFFLKNLKILDNFVFFRNDAIAKKNIYNYNNYYPVFYCNNRTNYSFFKKFKFNLNIKYYLYFNYYILSFLEIFFKKNFFLKFSTNHLSKHNKLAELKSIYSNYKNYQPKYMKNYFIRDFLEILWYSFFLKDLSLISEWVSKAMEIIHFRHHRKFLLFFQNFIHKYEQTICTTFLLSGFFFDIRGKVGVSGNSKKRHFFFKIGKISRSTKFKKINYKQSLVRTPSGVLGLTFILSY